MNKQSTPNKMVLMTGVFTTVAFTYFFFDSLMLPKFIVLFFGSIVAFYLFSRVNQKLSFNPKAIVILSSLLISSLLISGFTNHMAIYQILFGDWARYNGLLSYIFYMILFLLSSFSQSRTYIKSIITVLVYLGYFIVIVGLLELSGNNITGIISTDPHLKLTLGNSNFASIIIVITFSATYSNLIYKKGLNYRNIFLLISIALHTFLLYKTSATQGIVVLIFAVMFQTGIRFLASKSTLNIKIGNIILFSIPTIAVYTVFDYIFNGPVSHVVSIKTLVDRFYIWKTAISMWKDNLLTGVGIDSFGSWFGQYQNTESLKYKVITENYDNAHNIFLNFLATGGLLVFIAYCSITFFIAYCAFKLLKKKNFDSNLVALICIWLVIQIQALVSIDYLSISTWNWIIAGAIVSEYYFQKNDVNSKSNKKEYFAISKLASIGLRVVSIFIICITIMLLLPTVKAEYKINDLITDKKYALNSPELQLVNSDILSLALDIKYPDIKIYSVSALETFGDLSGALELAVDSTSRFPRSTRSWATLAHIYEVTGNKKLAVESWKKASELDPLNSIYKAKASENLLTEVN
jgi:O-antigen ligase